MEDSFDSYLSESEEETSVLEFQSRPYQKEIDNDTCAICLNDFGAGNSLVDLACKHKYHSECIVAWVKFQKKCPLCKSHLQ